MCAIAMLLAVTRAHCSAKTPASPAKPLNPSARCTTSPIHTALAKTRLKDQPVPTFAKSPLADADDMSAATIDAILAVHADGEVQRQAAVVRAKLLHVIEFAALRSEIAAAVRAIGTHSTDDLTPAGVVAVLRQRAAELDDTLDDARADRDTHEAVRKARMARIEPLRREVSQRLTVLANEREHCFVRLDASRRASTMGGVGGTMRHANLLAAGLTNEQINALGPAAQSSTEQEAAIRARIFEIDAELAPLRSYVASSDVTQLAALGLDALIAQAHPDRDGAEVTA
ncbi:hypothetical protein ACSFA7_22585 [Variovorax sp. LT1R20]|uniref:hypothetical protein n=1 Tax=Variovorax sp. LT1R20 TaxID=3443729 RepID=UPI003F454D41